MPWSCFKGLYIALKVHKGSVNIDTITTPDRPQSKTLMLLMNVNQKLLETVFSFAICPESVNKWQLKTLFLTIFDLRSSIVLCF